MKVLYRLATSLVLGSSLLLSSMFVMFAQVPITHADVAQASFGLQPVTYDPNVPATKSYFIFNSPSGTTIQNKVRIVNSGTVAGSADIYAVDATTSAATGAVYNNPDAKASDVGAWLSLGVQKVTLAAGASQIIPFTLTIPSNIRPGAHLGGILAVNLQQAPQSNSNAIQINIQNQTIVAVELNIAGPTIDGLQATGISAGGQNGYQSVNIGLHNTGDTLLKPQGSLQILDSQGHTIETLPLKMDTFLPQTAIQYPAYLSQALAAGDYSAILTLTYGADQVLHYISKFTVSKAQLVQVFASHPAVLNQLEGNNTPPLWLLIALGVIALLLVGTAFLWLPLVTRIFKRNATGAEQEKNRNMISTEPLNGSFIPPQYQQQINAQQQYEQQRMAEMNSPEVPLE